MTTVNATDIAGTIDSLLDRVRAGEEVSISDGGREVARLVPPASPPSEATPPDRLTAEQQADRDEWLEEVRLLRDSITVTGEPMSELVVRLRREAPY